MRRLQPLKKYKKRGGASKDKGAAETLDYAHMCAGGSTANRVQQQIADTEDSIMPVHAAQTRDL